MGWYKFEDTKPRKDVSLVLDGGCFSDEVIWLLGERDSHWKDRLCGHRWWVSQRKASGSSCGSMGSGNHHSKDTIDKSWEYVGIAGELHAVPMENPEEKGNCYNGNYENYDGNYDWVALSPPGGRTWYCTATLSQNLHITAPTITTQLQKAEKEGSWHLPIDWCLVL